MIFGIAAISAGNKSGAVGVKIRAIMGAGRVGGAAGVDGNQRE